jgi:hypothetical protein
MMVSVFLIQKPDNLLVSGRHSALSKASVERISGGNGQAERTTVVLAGPAFRIGPRLLEDDGDVLLRSARSGNLRADAPDAG